MGACLAAKIHGLRMILLMRLGMRIDLDQQNQPAAAGSASWSVSLVRPLHRELVTARLWFKYGAFMLRAVPVYADAAGVVPTTKDVRSHNPPPTGSRFCGTADGRCTSGERFKPLAIGLRAAAR